MRPFKALQHISRRCSLHNTLSLYRYVSLVKPFSTDTASYSLDEIKELRRLSGAPIKECKKALMDCNGSVNEAMDWLRIRGKAVAQSKSSQIAQYGFVGLFIDKNNGNKRASLIEVNCVTDFVENNENFRNAVLNIGNTILNTSNEYISINSQLNIDILSDNINIIPFNETTLTENKEQTISEALTDILSSIRENLVFRRAYKMTVSDKGVIGSYLHSRTNDNLGMKSALIGLETDINYMSDTQQNELILLANDIATHSVATYPQPKYINISDLSRKMIEKEEELILKTFLENDGDNINAEILKKKIDGKMKKYFRENVLLEQSFCLDDDDKLTIQKLIQKKEKDIGCNINISHMCVYNLGE